MKKLLIAAIISLSSVTTAAVAEVKVGIILGFTGPIESLTPAMRDGARMAFDEASNSGNLLGGETITILEADSTSCSAAAVAAAESTQVESASKIVIVSPPNRFPEFDASSNAILAPSLIAGVKDSIGPVKPRIIPTLISANAAVVTVDKLTITARSNFFIFPPKKYTFLYIVPLILVPKINHAVFL